MPNYVGVRSRDVMTNLYSAYRLEHAPTHPPRQNVPTKDDKSSLCSQNMYPLCLPSIQVIRVMRKEVFRAGEGWWLSRSRRQGKINR